jgi:hypothetical protein
MRDIKEPIRLAKLLAPYKGKWVTMTQDEKRVLGFGDTIDEALKAAEEKGELMPFLIKVPDESTSALLYWATFSPFLVLVLINDRVLRFGCFSGFSERMNDLGIGLLGGHGFFELFEEISFDQRNKLFRLKLPELT